MSSGGAPTFTDTYNPRGNPQIFHDLLGNSATVTPNQSSNLDLVATDGKNLNGIPYAVSGKARLVQTKVSRAIVFCCVIVWWLSAMDIHL